MRFAKFKSFWVVMFLPTLMAAGDLDPIVTLPLERNERGGLHVRTQSSDGIPLRLVFDTAAANSILFDHAGTDMVSRKLGRDQHVYFPFTDRLLGFRLINQFTIELGRHTFTSNNWVSGPWKPTGLFPGRETPNYDAIAGRDVFTTYAVAVDPRERMLSLYDSGRDFEDHYDTVLQLVETNEHMAVSVSITRSDTGETQDKLMIIDTAFPGVLMFANESELEILNVDELATPAETLPTAIVVPSMLGVGRMDPIEQNVLIVSKGGFTADGVLGTAFLNNYRYAFDMAAKKIYLSER
ncbi:hypothetical protein [Kordiimonas aquimaris]|uniref:hypothetical protein n=1 Tax=Kordiimonas aquimaris TaxID=707591 RepID=UPI0021CE79D8|nr:hypothetical protein [Kordiimonas aquimaris]